MSGPALTFGSVFSGIEAASVAWEPLGFKPVFFSEIAKFPCALLKHRYPHVPNHGDILGYQNWPDASIDVLCGGPPCQADSVAGKRGGMADPRGALKETYLRVVERFKPTWVLFEGVPGVLSVDGGRAFGALIGGLGELGYFGAWASLDAQYRGLAQRRNRVFFVGCTRGWQGPAAVLFDAASMRGDPAPRRAPGKNPAGTLSASAGGRGADEGERGTLVAGTIQAHHQQCRAEAAWTDRLMVETVGSLTAGLGPRGHGGSGLATDKGAEAGHILAFGGNNTGGPIEVATAVRAHGSFHQDFESETFIAHSLTASGFDASEDGTGRGTPLVPVTYDLQQITSKGNRSNPQPGDPGVSLTNPNRVITVNARQDPARVDVDVVGPLDTDGGSHAIAGDGAPRTSGDFGVRRLTPRECERLQGFPDDWTLIPYNGKLAKDGPRYVGLGNSWAVPVVRYIGKRMQTVHALLQQQTGDRA